MPAQEINIVQNDNGEITGLELLVRDDEGNERSVVFEPSDEGDIGIRGRGPNGEKGGKIDPSGNGDHPLGK